MADGDKVEKSNDKVDTAMKPIPHANLGKKDQAPRKDGSLSNSTSSITSSGDATSSIKGEADQKPVADQGYYPPTSCYGYYYPGYDGAYSEWDDRGYFNAGDGSGMTYPGVQSDSNSLVYYVPGYNPYASGSLMGVEGQCLGQQPYFSSGYLQPPISYGSEAVSPYSWDSMSVGDAPNGTGAVLAGPKPTSTGSTPTAAVKPKALNSIKTTGAVDAKVSAFPLDSKSCLPTTSSNFSKSVPPSQPLKPLNKVPQLGSNFQSAGSVKVCYPMRKFFPFSNQGQGFSPRNGPMNCRSNGRTWVGNDRMKDKFNRNGEFEASAELNRGPRTHRVGTPIQTSEKDQLGLTVSGDQYNLQDFQTVYENAKFFVIKSFNEDDIHKSIKYGVWASTPNGNKKLDTAFHEAETWLSETGNKCPVFLFFSVNASGQFVGLAEMIGQVDFNKDMDFWHLDKWSGFFPVKWHIIKDVPNAQLRHIILENNDNKPVTNSRDTQEIGFKQGLEMLTIFKSHTAKTSMLDDFNFYDHRETTLQTKKSNKLGTSLQMEIFGNSDLPNHLEAVDTKVEQASKKVQKASDPKTTLVTLAKNLSLNSQSPKKNSV
ncbi:PREDICTED: YTH domain-containing family protein 1 isoform X12 [Nelumbo nucifera]|uniref:YTH domain-containing family protein n=1 Tax=Nelumbo nucifera TaxID=4432 RepID=A0A1U7YVX2_NELNU|nr:PREDICTED: YTH domain-containing family protein 1 isoform X12 [Nelumbo nucifera]